MNGTGGVLVVGEALVDVVHPADGGPPAEHVGGSPANVAMGLARLGHPSWLSTHVGTDERGDRSMRGTISAPHEEVRDYFYQRRNYIHELDVLAEELAGQLGDRVLAVRGVGPTRVVIGQILLGSHACSLSPPTRFGSRWVDSHADRFSRPPRSH